MASSLKWRHRVYDGLVALVMVLVLGWIGGLVWWAFEHRNDPPSPTIEDPCQCR